ncbi:18245_t:CDS:2 [Acaulospora morrowiae]|uniref:18245_t:CDS:1 n=1 Tax=Acaulospora morrowiae TaxID=94023 RepID=A0A9N8VYR2_9GLOM|nr:18245_t:CDS:2 [Acaulospora morrowiae]
MSSDKVNDPSVSQEETVRSTPEEEITSSISQTVAQTEHVTNGVEEINEKKADAADDGNLTSSTKIHFTDQIKVERTTKPDDNVIESITRQPSDDDQNDAKKHVDIYEHLRSVEEVSAHYKVDVNTVKPAESRGLLEVQASKLLEEKGPNVLTPPKKKHPFMKYLECLLTLFNILLIFAGILMYILFAIDRVANKANSYLGAILIGVAFLNALIEFYQQQKSAAILESFLNMIPQKCHVIREGKLMQIQASNLVCGDVVFVRMGDKVPADLFVFFANDMKVDNSTLTGEADPQERKRDNDQKNPLEATNLCFNGTLVVSGEGYGIVIRTGDNTVLGQIAGLTAGEDKNKSPLSQEIDNFVKIIATIAIACAIIFFGIGFKVNNNNFSLTISFAISVLVAWVPEGLPATVTVLLTIAAKRMAAQNVLVKDLQGVETLGAITLLATDKTGTLTRNQMTVTNIWSSLKMYSAFQNAQNENIPFDSRAPGIEEIIHISLLCSRAKFDRNDIPFAERQIFGDATETGLIRFAGNQIDDYDELINKYPKVFEIPFNSDTKWALSVHQKSHKNGPLTLYIKGAPERVLGICSSILSDKTAIPLTEEHKHRYDEVYEYMASKGHRVLAFAQYLLPGDQYPEGYEFKKELKNYPLSDLCFVGLVSLEDPPKHGVREAIGRCRTAGIRVIMVTGDHPLTAEAIGRKINLMKKETKPMMAKRTGVPIENIGEDEYEAIVIHGEQIDSLSEAEWDNIFAKEEIIFARTSPRHKLEIVKHAQAMGHIVGVTGDGVNDSPALKKADLGISMNISGSDVSKEAAAMILMDDNFASTVHGIEEGRLIFSNLKKSIQYTISHSTPEVMVCLLYVIVPIPLPLTPLLVILVDLGFELFIALTYAWDPPESRTALMELRPRKPVTPESIKKVRRRALSRTPTITDTENGRPIRPSKVSIFFQNLKKYFTVKFWSEFFEDSDDEVLVDNNLLCWAYIEIGIIEAIGCVVSFFVVLNANGVTPYDAQAMQKDSSNHYFTDNASNYTTATGRLLNASDQVDILGQANSIVYLAILIQQIFNLFACKARYRLPFGKFMFANPRNFIGVVLGFGLAMMLIYIPAFNVAFGTSHNLSPKYWFIPVAFGVFILFYATMRTLIMRKIKPASVVQGIEELKLDMYPTVYSR